MNKLIRLIGLCSGLLLSACSSSSGFESPNGTLALNTSAIDIVGSNEVKVYNTGKTAITITKVSLEDRTTAQIDTEQDSLDDTLSTCSGTKLDQGETCKIIVNVNKGKTGVDAIIFETSIGTITDEIKINSPLGDIEIQPNYINKVGDNLFTITNNRNSNIVLNSLALAKNNTQDDSSDIYQCFNKTLKPSETCQFHIKGFVGESGSDVITLVTPNKNYTYNVAVTTVTDDLQLDKTLITESGNTNINLVNKGSGVIKINYLGFTAKDTLDSADVADCVGKILTQNQQCTITVTSLDKVAGLDALTAYTDVGNYTNDIRVDSTDAAILDSDDSANITTTKETSIKIYNKGSLPVTLQSLEVTEGTSVTSNSTNASLKLTTLGASDDIVIEDSTCLNKPLNGGAVCEIKAKAKGGIQKDSIVGFTSTNQYMQKQKVYLTQRTNHNNLAFYESATSTSQAITEVVLDSPTIKTLYIKNDGTNDMNIKGISLSNSIIGSIVQDDCTGKNIYATESCPAQIQVASDAYSKVYLQVDTEQPQPNSKLLLSVNNKNLIFSDNSTVGTMPTNIQKTFTVVNPNNFDIYVSNVLNDGNVYTIIDNQCIGKISAKASCTIAVKSNSGAGTTKLTLVSDSFSTPQEMTMIVNNSIKITSVSTDNAFQSAFLISNDNPNSGTMTIDNYSGGTFIANGQNPELFAGVTNCMQYNNNIPNGVSCKYILSLPSNDPNSNFGNVVFNFTYTSGDIVSQTFIPSVTRRTVNTPATYKSGQTINATQAVSNTSCGISTATYVSNSTGTYIYQSCQANSHGDSNCYDHTGSFNDSAGYLLYIASDGVTVRAISFVTKSSSCVDKQDFVLYNTSSGGRTVINNSYDNITTWDLNCSGGACSLPITMNILNWKISGNYGSSTKSVPTTTATLSNPSWFTQPVAAQNYTVIDSITWIAQ